MAWFEKRVAAEAGTATAKARAGLGHAGDPSQFDCLDKTSNTVGVLMIVADMGLLRHHVIDVPESRGFLIGGLPHTTAVVRERKERPEVGGRRLDAQQRRIAGRAAAWSSGAARR